MTALAGPEEFSVSVEPNGWVAFVRPHGELDLGTAPLLEQALEEVDGYDRLVLDLRGLAFMDVSGVHLLLRVCERADDRCCVLRVIPGSEAQRVLELAGGHEPEALVPAALRPRSHPS